MESSGDGDDMFPQFVTKIISLTKYSSALSLAVARVRFPLGRMMFTACDKDNPPQKRAGTYRRVSYQRDLRQRCPEWYLPSASLVRIRHRLLIPPHRPDCHRVD